MAETNLKNLKGGALKKALQKVGSSLWAMDTTKDNIKILENNLANKKKDLAGQKNKLNSIDKDIKKLGFINIIFVSIITIILCIIFTFVFKIFV